MKFKLNLTKKEIMPFVYFALGQLILCEFIFYKTGLINIALISLKITLFIHLSGYFLTLYIFKEEFDNFALLFLGLSLGLIITSLLYYLLSLIGLYTMFTTYPLTITILIVTILLHLKKKQTKSKEE